MLYRRCFLGSLTATAVCSSNLLSRLHGSTVAPTEPVSVDSVLPGEDIFGYIQRRRGSFDQQLYLQLLGASNEFKEGDAIVGVAAANDTTRRHARTLLANTRLASIDNHPPLVDGLFALIEKYRDRNQSEIWKSKTLGQLKQFLLLSSEHDIHSMKAGLSSDVIGCLVKLMTNQELIAIGSKIFNPLPVSNIGAKGYLGARVQPNSPTDNVDDIRWQVFDAFAYAVGDVLLGTNPVSSDPESVVAVERALQDILVTFGIDDAMPHCVLAHIDVQSQVERRWPGTTELWFQSIAGSDTANATFDLTNEKMEGYAQSRSDRFGLYFETGQGADFTNGHGHGFDMVLHESRKYGFARALTHQVAAARQSPDAWVHLNDVAGFIGPEVFRTREQLVRCCLEDIVMGKLHGLTLGLDVCSTLHMDVSLDDLDWCLHEIAPACPAYLMSLPTKIDPMLGYLTTGYHDHVRLREEFGFRVNDRMWDFFKELKVIDSTGNPTNHFGNPTWVYLQYCRRKGDQRTDQVITSEAREQLEAVRSRGVFVSEGFGNRPSQLPEKLRSEINQIYTDSKQCIWRQWEDDFVNSLPNAIRLQTESLDRSDYILHPSSGERLRADSQSKIESLRAEHRGQFDVQIVVSEGLNALALMDPGNLLPLITELYSNLQLAGSRVAKELLVVNSGRVRAGYRIGETLFGGLTGRRILLHIIGERPGSGHHTMSIYATALDASEWNKPGHVDHNHTKVISGISTTALPPTRAAKDAMTLLKK